MSQAPVSGGAGYGSTCQPMKTMEAKSLLQVAAEFLPARDGARWYVLFVRSNQEKRVALGLSDRGIEHLLPCYGSLRQWKDRRVKLDIPLFPGYLFVHLPLSERMQALTIPSWSIDWEERCAHSRFGRRD